MCKTSLSRRQWRSAIGRRPSGFRWGFWFFFFFQTYETLELSKTRSRNARMWSRRKNQSTRRDRWRKVENTDRGGETPSSSHFRTADRFPFTASDDASGRISAGTRETRSHDYTHRRCCFAYTEPLRTSVWASTALAGSIPTPANREHVI